jgi:hypothetical protein
MMDELQIEERPIGIYGLDDLEGSDERLAYLLQTNGFARQRDHRFGSTRDFDRFELMEHPLSQTRAFALFGLTLGAFGPFSIGFNWILSSGAPNSDELIFPILFLLANITTAVVGYFHRYGGRQEGRCHPQISGPFGDSLTLFDRTDLGRRFRLRGRAVPPSHRVCGGAVIGAAFGGIATVIFGILHRYLQVAGSIELRHFLPLAFGTTFILCAFILGL